MDRSTVCLKSCKQRRSTWRAHQYAASRQAMLAGVRPQRAAEEGQRPVPRQLRPHRVELGPGNTARPNRCLVGKRMMRKVAMKLDIDLALGQLALQCVDRFSREERVLRGP